MLFYFLIYLKNMENILNIDEKGSLPIYKQIVSSILFKISIGELQINDKIPSINSLSEEYCLRITQTKDTATKKHMTCLTYHWFPIMSK